MTHDDGAAGAEQDLKWAAASEFIRDVVFALGKPEPAPEAIIDLPALALEVVGQIEELKVDNARLRSALRAPQPQEEQPQAMTHGRNCPKLRHVGGGYLHGADDDRPYDVDGVLYCGRCHGWMGEARAALRAPQPQEDDERRCAVCGWTLATSHELGCVRGSCSQRPFPDRFYAPERAANEYGQDLTRFDKAAALRAPQEGDKTTKI